MNLTKQYKPGEEKKLSEILDTLNERYGGIFKDENTILLKNLVETILMCGQILASGRFLFK